MIVEAGVVTGVNRGDAHRDFSKDLFVSEVGFLYGALPGDGESPWGFGGTLFMSVGDNDIRAGIKPRVRCRLTRSLSADVSAGLIMATANNDPGFMDRGFVGGVSLNYSSWFSVRGDVMVRPVEQWRSSHYWIGGHEYVDHPAGHEVSFYAGAAFRGRPGGVVLGLAVVAGVLYLRALAQGLSRLN
jgi:hypothetical protein